VTQGPPSRNTGQLCLAALVLQFSIALAWPSAAYPGTGMLLWLGAIGVLALSGLHWRGAPRDIPSIVSIVAIIVYTGLWCGGLMRAPVPPLGRDATNTIVLGALIFISAFLAARGWERDGLARSPVQFLCVALAAILGMAALFGIYQVAGPGWMPRTFAAMERGLLELPADEPMRDALLHSVREARASGSIGAANIYASFCVFGFCVAGGAMQATRHRFARAAWALVGIACAGAVVASGSNGGVVALLGVAVLLPLILISWRLPRRRVVVLGVGAAALLLIVVSAIIVIVIHFPTTNQRWLGKTGLTQRANYWMTAWHIWSQHPILGAGPGSFEVLYPQFRSVGANETRFPHSWIFEVGASVGFLGLAMFAAFCGAVAVGSTRLLSSLRREGDFASYAATAGLAAGCAGLIAHGLIEYTISFREAALLLFLVSGVLLGALAREEAPQRRSTTTMVGFALGALLLLVPFWFLQAVPAEGESARDYAADLYYANGDAREAMLAASDAITADPSHPEGYALRGHFRQMMGDGGARGDYERAIALNPYSARYRELLGAWFADQGDLAAAIREQRAARALHPLDAGHALAMVDLLMRNEETEAARETLREALDLKATSTTESQRRRDLAAQLGVALPEGNE